MSSDVAAIQQQVLRAQNTSGYQSPVQVSAPSSGRSTPRSMRSNLSLDLSNLPPLIKPSPPTNTLIITNLNNLEIFSPDHLQTLRDLINATATILTWSPLKSFRRIVCSFESEEDAIRVRSILDGEGLMGERIRVYFGQNTPIRPVDQHLQAPESKKLFFISPPPSPPHGWEMRNEEPPNTVFLADDLADALHKLAWNQQPIRDQENSADVTASPVDVDIDIAEDDGAAEIREASGDGSNSSVTRKRSGSSTVLFTPADDDRHEMPGIIVDDFSDNESSPISAEPSPKMIPVPASILIPHTARPPVETMHDA